MPISHSWGGGCSQFKDLGGISTKRDSDGNYLSENNRRPIEKVNGRMVIQGTKHIVLGGILDDNCFNTYAREGKLFEFNDISFSDWLPDLYRVLKPNTHCYIMINARNLKDLQIECEKVGFVFQQLLVWNKRNTTPNRYYLNACEFILMLRKGKARNINNMGTKNILDVKNIRGNKQHPTEKPVELMKILVENSSNVGDVVLDPFMGVGSTGIACQELNRNFIGIEIDEKYFNRAKERLKMTEKWDDLN